MKSNISDICHVVASVAASGFGWKWAAATEKQTWLVSSLRLAG